MQFVKHLRKSKQTVLVAAAKDLGGIKVVGVVLSDLGGVEEEVVDEASTDAPVPAMLQEGTSRGGTPVQGGVGAECVGLHSGGVGQRGWTHRGRRPAAGAPADGRVGSGFPIVII